MSKVEVRPSQAGESAGYGLFLSPAARTQHGPPPRRWWWPFGRSDAAAAASAHQRIPPLAAFPLSSALTAANIASDPAAGHGYGWMLGRGVVDERTVIMAYLVVERLKGQGSALAPWLEALPRAFHTPLWFTPVEMADLRGTTLDKATEAVRTRLQQLWSRIGPVLSGVAKGAGVTREPALEDLMWAHSVFWSRGQSLPVPREGGAASQLLALDPSAASTLEVHEGIVPGLDFCNHHPTGKPQCWWEVVSAPPSSRAGAPAGAEASPSQGPQPGYEPPSGSIQLRLHRGASARAGDELFIDYGEKSNEELLVLYGFVVPSNPNDHVMLACPIAPAVTWDDVMHARMEMLRACGMRPQFFLRARDVHPSDLQLGPRGSSGQAAGGKGAKGGAAPKGVTPGMEAVLEVLEVFVMDIKELNQRMQVINEGGSEDDEGGHNVPSRQGQRLSASEVEASLGKMDLWGLRAQEQHLGLRMGALSTLLRLLELRMVELEDERQGTGALEADLAALEQGGLPHRKWCSVVYRAEQKRIVRGWVRATQRELQEVMRVLGAVNDLVKDKQRAASVAKGV